MGGDPGAFIKEMNWVTNVQPAALLLSHNDQRQVRVTRIGRSQTKLPNAKRANTEGKVTPCKRHQTQQIELFPLVRKHGVRKNSYEEEATGFQSRVSSDAHPDPVVCESSRRPQKLQEPLAYNLCHKSHSLFLSCPHYSHLSITETFFK